MHINFHLKIIFNSEFAIKPKAKESFVFLRERYVVSLHSTRVTTAKVAHLKMY
jgi:hypothetical protein